MCIQLSEAAIVDLTLQSLQHMAAQAGHVRALALLIAANAFVNRLDQWLQTPAHFAAAYGHAGALRVLVQAGANLGLLDMRGRTPADLAAKYNHVAVLKVLVTSGMPVPLDDSARTKALQSIVDTAYQRGSHQGECEEGLHVSQGRTHSPLKHVISQAATREEVADTRQASDALRDALEAIKHAPTAPRSVVSFEASTLTGTGITDDDSVAPGTDLDTAQRNAAHWAAAAGALLPGGIVAAVTDAQHNLDRDVHMAAMQALSQHNRDGSAARGKAYPAAAVPKRLRQHMQAGRGIADITASPPHCWCLLPGKVKGEGSGGLLFAAHDAVMHALVLTPGAVQHLGSVL